MSNVTRFPSQPIYVERQRCDKCGSTREYWLDDDSFAYGLCGRCDLLSPDEIYINEKGQDPEKSN